MHVVNRGSSRASGKQAKDLSRTPQVSFIGGVDTLVVRFALAELVLWAWKYSHSHERMEQAEADDTSHV